MGTAHANDFFRHLTRGLAAEPQGEDSDRRLVERALAGRDELAFQAIVRRHGPMVYRVCWRVLQHPQDAEDAFQAAFLILARKLRSVRNHASLASWLHGVGHRVALKARAQAGARRRHEQQAARPDARPPEEVTWRELRAALDGELIRLPEKWRLPLVLCYLEGRTQDEAAGELGWSKSTLRRRLEEARTALACRLGGRGLGWPAALAAVLVSDCLTTAAPAPGLVAATVDAAAGVAAGKLVATAAPARVAALTEGVLKTMLLNRLRMATAVLAFLSLVTAGVGGLSYKAPVPTGHFQEAQPVQQQAPPPAVQDARPLVEKARELDEAKLRHKEAAAVLEMAQRNLQKAQERYEEEQDRYEAAKAKGQGKEENVVGGRLVKVNPEEHSIRVECWKTVHGKDRSFTARVYVDFPVAKTALIAQDNAKTKLAGLHLGGYIILKLDGKSAVSIVLEGATVGGPVRFVSANAARNTITVIAGRKDERRIYHLVKETEVITDRGKPARVQDLKEGTLLLLTRSVEDTNTVIRIETLSPAKEQEE
jgi:RNA polymerase sigma factor (sigma-70 family)